MNKIKQILRIIFPEKYEKYKYAIVYCDEVMDFFPNLSEAIKSKESSQREEIDYQEGDELFYIYKKIND